MKPETNASKKVNLRCLSKNEFAADHSQGHVPLAWSPVLSCYSSSPSGVKIPLLLKVVGRQKTDLRKTAAEAMHRWPGRLSCPAPPQARRSSKARSSSSSPGVKK